MRISDWSSYVCSSDLFLLLLPMPVLDDDAVLIVIKVHRRAALGALPVLDGLARALAGWPLALVRRRRQALAPGIDIAVELRGLAVVDDQIPVAEREGLAVAPNSRLFRHLAAPPVPHLLRLRRALDIGEIIAVEDLAGLIAALERPEDRKSVG